MAQWLKPLTDSYRGPRCCFILTGDGNVGKKLHAWVIILGPWFLSHSLLPHEGFMQSHIPTWCSIQTHEAWQPWARSEIENPHESRPVRYFLRYLMGKYPSSFPSNESLPSALHYGYKGTQHLQGIGRAGFSSSGSHFLLYPHAPPPRSNIQGWQNNICSTRHLRIKLEIMLKAKW